MNAVSPKAIIDFFDKLNLSGIDYILIRNIGRVLPNSLELGKDIDLLVKYRDRTKIIDFLKHNTFEQLPHPHDNDIFLYGVNEFEFFTNSEGVLIDLNYQFSCRSLNAGEWIPLDQAIQESAWNNKRFSKNDNLNCFRLSIDDEFVTLVSRAIFEKAEFSKAYTSEINDLLKNINPQNVLKKLELIFFKYAPILLKQIQDNKYDTVFEKYIAFKEY